MKRMFLAVLIAIMLVPSARATLLNISINGGAFATSSGPEYGINLWDVVNYSGSFFIDTSAIDISQATFINGHLQDIIITGNFVTSGAITINDYLFQIFPNDSENFILRGGEPSTSFYETGFGFRVLSPLTEIGSFWIDDMHFSSIFDYSEDYFNSNEDPLSQYLQSLTHGWWNLSFPSGLGVHGVGNGTTGISGEFSVPGNLSVAVAPVPEPSTILLLTTGIIGLFAKRKLPKI